MKSDHRSKFSNLSNWKEEAWKKKKKKKNQGFNGIRTRDLRDTGAMLYQLSYELFHINFTGCCDSNGHYYCHFTQ